MHMAIPWGALERSSAQASFPWESDVIDPDVAWASGFFKSSPVLLMCSQSGKAMHSNHSPDTFKKFFTVGKL
jgi:hypothetical protein